MDFVQKAKRNPKWHYSLSICATWAGAGSLIVGIMMVQQFGTIPFLLWALGNTLCCVLFGLLAKKIPALRKIFTNRIMKIVIGLMCVFQLWVNMSGIHDSLAIINPVFATVTTYVLSIGFLLLYLRFAMFRNVLSDDVGWRIVYLMIFLLALSAIVTNGVTVPTSGMNQEGITLGVQRFFTLLVGPFFYPYFWELFDYNERENGKVSKVNMTKCFAVGGALFGIYILFVFMLGLTSFSPAMEIVNNPTKYFHNKRAMKLCENYKSLMIRYSNMIEKKHYKKMYLGLLSGDTKSRTLRSLQTQIYGDYLASQNLEHFNLKKG